jgi:hypothetical protein
MDAGLRCAACGVDRPAGSFSAMQRKKGGNARCKSCLKHGVEETLRRERLAAEPHVRWAEPVVDQVREIPSRAQNGTAERAADGAGITSAGDADWRWARGARSMSAQSSRIGMMPPRSDSDNTSSSEEEERFFNEMCAASRRGGGDPQPARADYVPSGVGAAEARTPGTGAPGVTITAGCAVATEDAVDDTGSTGGVGALGAEPRRQPHGR